LKNQQDDIERIHKVVKFIEQNLAKDLSLDDLAQLACYSPFHFQRIFKELMGETPKQLIKRLRLETAAHSIVLYPETSILEVAFQTGFNSLEAFSRAFKDYYSISPDFFKKSNEEEKLKIIQNPQLSEKFLDSPSSFLSNHINHSEFKDLYIEVVKRPVQKLVYIQTYLSDLPEINKVFKKIKQWVNSRELVSTESKLFGLIRDYPLFTPLDKCRYLVCMSVEKQPELSGVVNYMEFSVGKYATFQVTGSISKVIQAISYIVHFWLPENGYQLDPQPVTQVPLQNPIEVPFDKNTYQIYIHIKPA
jgi:AraC family transcriptional regulator